MQKNTIKLKEVSRFLVGGGSAVVVDYVVYTILLSVIDLSLAKAISFICGSIVGFIINKLWTFESKKFEKKELGKYAVLYIVTGGINAMINVVVLRIVDVQILAFLCATGTSTILNFIGQKFFVFSKRSSL